MTANSGMGFDRFNRRGRWHAVPMSNDRPAGPAGLVGIAPVQRESTVDLIASRIRAAVIAGTLPAGAPLREVELAAQLGVSRGPLREAAQRLVGERVLVSRKRGLAVSTLSVDDVVDVLLARAAVEHAACRRVLAGDPNTVEETVRTLRSHHQQLVVTSDRGDAPAMADAEVAFHRALVNAAGSPRLTAMLTPLLIESRLCSFAVRPQPGSVPVSHTSADEHEAIVVALAAADEQGCLAAIDAHFSAVRDRILDGSPSGLGEVS